MVVVNGEGANTGKEQNKANDVKKDENKAGETKNGEELGENSKGKEKRARPRNRNKKKDAEKASGTLAAVEDKPESSSKRKASKRVECMGMVFMCSSKTKTDCFRYKVLGLPGNKKDQVAKIYKGMRLFLFDVDLRLMYGIFKAAAPGGYNLEPKAFNSEFPSQVRFTVLEDCLPVAEEKFKEVLKKNYYTRNKFEGLLHAEQVKDLCKLFCAGRGTRRKPAAKLPRSRAVENHRVRGDESRRIRADDSHISRRREKRKRQPREEERRPREGERRPRSPPRREKRRHTDYERPPILYEREAPVRYEREPPVLYEREAPVARYLPPPVASPVRYYERPIDMAPYVRDRVPEHHAYRVIDVDLSRDRERERDPYQVYSREPPYRDPVYTLPPEYIVPRDYRPPVVQAAEYRLSGGGSSLASYRDVELATTDYRSSAPSLPEYRSVTHYRY
ncbi:development/cell death domain-containing protein [Artemisia annua]|uniref:Development/cell death domain-containing protein n=1 Tax=Artemisia annua TaxID=35608 RepID=A0A2U1L5K0_ARTAN|nr:development/cell death domain-containing protein [Artemisia annua]